MVWLGLVGCSCMDSYYFLLLLLCHCVGVFGLGLGGGFGGLFGCLRLCVGLFVGWWVFVLVLCWYVTSFFCGIVLLLLFVVLLFCLV